MRADCATWRTWPRAKFIKHLKLLFPPIKHLQDKTYLESIAELKFTYDLADYSSESSF